MSSTLQKSQKHMCKHWCKKGTIQHIRDLLEKTEMAKGYQAKEVFVLELMEFLFFRQCGRAMIQTEPKFRTALVKKLKELREDPRNGYLFVEYEVLSRQIDAAIAKETN